MHGRHCIWCHLNITTELSLQFHGLRWSNSINHIHFAFAEPFDNLLEILVLYFHNFRRRNKVGVFHIHDKGRIRIHNVTGPHIIALCNVDPKIPIGKVRIDVVIKEALKQCFWQHVRATEVHNDFINATNIDVGEQRRPLRHIVLMSNICHVEQST